MDLQKISPGKNPPWDVNALIEVPIGGVPVKYELDKDSGAIFVDRFLHTSMQYPGNYGFVPHTLADDGDPLDIMIATDTPVVPGAVVRVRPVGVLIMEDEAGMDEKVLAVPVDDLHPYYAGISSYRQLPQILLDKIAHFFEHYKDLEPRKWVKVQRWGEADEACRLIERAIANAKAGKKPKLVAKSKPKPATPKRRASDKAAGAGKPAAKRPAAKAGARKTKS